MADRGFTIEENLKDLGVTLNIPAFLDGRDQLERDEVVESQSIAKNIIIFKFSMITNF